MASEAEEMDCVSGDLDGAEFAEWPFSPEQEAEGAPKALGTVLWRSRDRTAAAGFWKCDAGTFTRTYPWTEVATILDGGGAVTTSDGEEHVLRPGVVLVLPLGVTATWRIPSRIEKAFHLSSGQPLPI